MSRRSISLTEMGINVTFIVTFSTRYDCANGSINTTGPLQS